MKKPLMLYTGFFNYAHQVVKRHTMAPSEKSAKARMINQLAKEHGVHPALVAGVFNGEKDNFVIEVDKEWAAKNIGKAARP